MKNGEVRYDNGEFIVYTALPGSMRLITPFWSLIDVVDAVLSGSVVTSFTLPCYAGEIAGAGIEGELVRQPVTRR